MKNGTTAALLAMAATLSLTACKSNGGGTVALSGAGSTFVYPVMSRWTDEFQQKHANVQINYQSIGSGGGIQQVKAGTVDFGASDAALSDAQMAQMPPVLQVPESAGPVAVIYNLPELKQPLQLSAQTLAGVFLGTIKSWQDPQIKKDNPGATLPAQAITVVHRADGSGTTNIFTTYLSDVSPDWKTKVGSGTQVSWPTGNGGKGSEGVTGQVRQSAGAVGYVDLTYALQNKLPFASIKNRAGKYIQPTTDSATAAINGFAEQLSADPRTPIVNPPDSAAAAYPITGLTFLILPKDGPDKAKRQALKDFVKFVVTDGQAVAGQLNYAPLPDAVKQADLQKLNQLTAGGQPLQ